MAPKDQAIGAWEAACVLGVHWVTVARMAEKGLIQSRELRASSEDRVFRVYSLADCEENWAEYADICRRNGGRAPRHPRTMAHMRFEALQRLQNEPVKIAFRDAVSAIEASEIMGVHPSFPAKQATNGAIEGRVLWSGRPDSSASRLWVFSRRSCEKNRVVASALAAQGIKSGRPRSSLDQ